MNARASSRPSFCALLHVIDAAVPLQSALGDEICRLFDALVLIESHFPRASGFDADCVALPVSGDDPCRLAAVGLPQVRDIVDICLGTSYALMVVVPTAGQLSSMRLPRPSGRASRSSALRWSLHSSAMQCCHQLKHSS